MQMKGLLCNFLGYYLKKNKKFTSIYMLYYSLAKFYIPGQNSKREKV